MQAKVVKRFQFSGLQLGTVSVSTKRKAIRDTNQRHTAWVSKTVALPGEKTAWRPRPVYRSAAKKFVDQVDNVIRFNTSFEGLSFIVYDEGAPAWKPENWRSWPSLVLAIDQGSDGLAGTNAMLRKLDMNLLPFFEFCHGANNDLHGIFKELKVYDLALILLIVMNMAHGPDKDEGMLYDQFQA